MPATPLQARLSYRVSRLARILQSQVEGILAPEGLTRMMWLVLTGIGEDDVRSPSEMAVYIGISRPATSRLLRRMETLDHVARQSDQSDGRGVTLTLTACGQGVLARCRPPIDALMARITAKIDPETHTIVLTALGQLAEGEGVNLNSF